MSFIIGANSAVAGGFAIDNSCMFNGSADFLKKDRAGMSTATNQKKFTISTWVKRSELGDAGMLWSSYHNATNYLHFQFQDSDAIKFKDFTGSTRAEYITTRLFRDVSAFYHILLNVDTTDGTAGDRQQIWINGVRETAFGTSSSYSINTVPEQGTTDIDMFVGREGGGADYYNGYLAQNVFIDGLALEPDSFGEFDADSGIWKPIGVSGLTFGANGYFLNFEDSANLGNDANGGTDFAETGLAAINQATDTPTNNFATLNPLIPSQGGFTPGSATFTEGATIFTTVNASGSYSRGNATMLLSSGKWYTEIKYVNSGTVYGLIGVTGSNPTSVAAYPGVYAYDYAWYGNGSGGNFYNNNGIAAYLGAGYANNDILGMAIDLDSGTKTIQYYKNGSAVSSAQTIVDPATTDFGGYCITIGEWSSSTNATFEVNFGNPSFSGTDKADGNGYGSFEYTPPTGFLAICTKNLSEVLS